jgi:hypothetical protein
MASHIIADRPPAEQLERGAWLTLGLVTAAASIVPVLIVQWLAITMWPEIALFAPLDSYARTALFTLVPVMGATALFAWLAGHRPQPERAFITISAVVLLLSIIPDYVIPVPHKTVLASSVTAFLHVMAAVTTVGLLVSGYRRQVGRARGPRR